MSLVAWAAGCKDDKRVETKPGPSTQTQASSAPSSSTTAMAVVAHSSAASPPASSETPAPSASHAEAKPSQPGNHAHSAHVDHAPAPSASPSSAASTASTASTIAGGEKAYACGEKGQPKCPLQSWMNRVMQPPYQNNDPKKLADALRASVKLGPPGYSNWAKWSLEGAAAVEKAGNKSAAKASCKGCHKEYQKRYQREMRDRPI